MGVVNMRLSRNRKLKLDTVSLSHYSEKVRWCMDKLGVDYVEEQDAGVFGIFLFARSVFIHFKLLFSIYLFIMSNYYSLYCIFLFARSVFIHPYRLSQQSFYNKEIPQMKFYDIYLQ